MTLVNLSEIVKEESPRDRHLFAEKSYQESESLYIQS